MTGISSSGAALGTAPAIPQIMVIGIGNEQRRDDGVGLVIARRLKQQVGDLIQVKEESGEAASLMEAWKGADTVIVFDAVISGSEPGEIFRVDAVTHAVPTKFGLHASHGMGLAQAVELARAMGQLPRRLALYGIEGSDFGIGPGLSPEVEKAVQRLVQATLVAVRSAERLGQRKVTAQG